jgi:multidrug transporter EmrE-like cation transporter
MEKDMKLAVLAGLCGWAVLYGAGEYCSKLWSQRPSIGLTILVVISYSLGALIWLPALRAHGNLGILTTIFSVVGTVVGVLIGLLLFHEPVSVKQFVGIGLALVSIALLC